IHRVLPGLPPDRAAELAKAAFTVQDLPAGLSLDDARLRLAEAGREGPAFLLAGGPVFRLLSHPDPVQLAGSMPAGTSAPWPGLHAVRRYTPDRPGPAHVRPVRLTSAGTATGQ